MALWFKCLLIVLELSFVLSAVIVVKLEDKEEITAIIESKVDKQEQELEQLKNITKVQDSTINVTFQDELDYQKNHINRLTEENRELKPEISQTAEDLKQLKKIATTQFDDLNSTFNHGYDMHQGQIKKLDDGLKRGIKTILERAKKGTIHIQYI